MSESICDGVGIGFIRRCLRMVAATVGYVLVRCRCSVALALEYADYVSVGWRRVGKGLAYYPG